ncbi:oligosaccharide flippase family protein [Aliarcobacter butzleri]|uniref:oligosaccharide flippase family protein n=1 Tax=Aliarcobacter butzleri TaxID=28197 RepID=UPI0012FBBDF9|nr:oligosaccharide flippase family protein [Aliarcobacter butzleri]
MIKHIINYLGSSFSSKLIVFFSAIVYSRLMTVEEFGFLNLYISYLWIFVIIFSSNLYTAIGRYIYEEREDFNHFFSTTSIIIFLFSIISIFILMYDIDYFEKFLRLPREIIFILIITTIALILESIFTQIAVYHQQSTLVFKLTFYKSMGAFVLSLIFLFFIVNYEKYFAVIYAELIISVFLILYFSYKLRKYFSLKYNKAHIKYMMNYSIPLIPYMLSLTLLSQSDRIMIDYFYGNKETGLYSMAYNLGIVLVLVIAALLNAWNPSYFKYMNNKDYKKVERGSNNIFLICIFITLLIVLFGENIASVILSEEYESNLHLISVISIGGLASSIWQIWGRIIGYVNKTYITSILAVIATILNIGLNYYLLPIYGYEIAAWTTLASYLVIGILALTVSNFIIGYYYINIFEKLFKILLLICLVLFFEYIKLNLYIEFFLKMIICVSFIMFYKKQLFLLKKELI